MTPPATDLAEIVRRCPYHRHLGIGLQSQDAEKGRVRLGMDLGPELLRADNGGGLHGGAIASLMDVAAAYAVMLCVRDGGVTVALSVDYLRAVSGTRAEAEAWVVKSGRTQAVADVELFDGKHLAAIARVRFAFPVNS